MKFPQNAGPNENYCTRFFFSILGYWFFFPKKSRIIRIYARKKKVQNFPFMLNKRQKAVARKKTKKN